MLRGDIVHEKEMKVSPFRYSLELSSSSKLVPKVMARFKLQGEAKGQVSKSGNFTIPVNRH